MIVYRVETSLGKGPYYYEQPHSDEWEIAIAHHREGDEQHPSMHDDNTMVEDWDWHMIFGFASIDDCRAWFNGAERLFLSTFGHFLSAYEVSGKIAIGHKQLAFHRANAKLLWQKPLNHF